MRQTISLRLCAVILALALVSCSNQKEEAAGGPRSTEPVAMPDTAYKRYAVKQAHIHYENSGHLRGSEDLYFMDWGRREARYSNIEMLRPEGVQPRNMVTITDGSMMTMADMTRMSGSHFREPFLDSLIQLKDPESPEETSVKVLTNMKYTRKGTDTVLGKTTEVWVEPTSGTTLWLWGGVVLRQRVNTPDQMHEVNAVSIDTVNPIDISKFTPPAGIKYSEEHPGMPGMQPK